MNTNPQQLGLEVLVDWLAEETQQYTKAFISGKNAEALIRHRENMEVLIAEIRRRKREDLLPRQVVPELPPNDLFDSTP